MLFNAFSAASQFYHNFLCITTNMSLSIKLKSICTSFTFHSLNPLHTTIGTCYETDFHSLLLAQS